MLNFKLCLAACTIWMSGSVGFSQTAKDSVGSTSPLVPHHAIKISPLHLLNFYPTLQIAYEHKILNRITAQLDAGYVWNYFSPADGSFDNKRGTKLKLEGRYYYVPGAAKRVIGYAAMEVALNRIKFDRSGSRRECYDTNCQHEFIRQYTLDMSYYEDGAAVKIGFLHGDGKFVFDVNFGPSLRDIRYFNSNGEPEVEALNWDLIDETDRVVVGFVVGVRAGYSF